MALKHKKIIAREILIFFSVSAAITLIALSGFIFTPKCELLPVNSKSFDAYGNFTPEFTQESLEYSARGKIRDNWIAFFWILGWIVVIVVYPARMIYYLLRWAIRTIKESDINQNA